MALSSTKRKIEYTRLLATPIVVVAGVAGIPLSIQWKHPATGLAEDCE
jgi:hypothetical protein